MKKRTIEVTLNSGVRVIGEKIDTNGLGEPYTGNLSLDREPHILIKQYVPHTVMIKWPEDKFRFNQKVRHDYKIAMVFDRTIREIKEF